MGRLNAAGAPVRRPTGKQAVADQRECQLAFGIGRGRAAAELGGLSKELQPSRATRYAIDDDCAGKYPEEQNPQLMASATVNLNLPPLYIQGVSY